MQSYLAALLLSIASLTSSVIAIPAAAAIPGLANPEGQACALRMCSDANFGGDCRSYSWGNLSGGCNNLIWQLDQKLSSYSVGGGCICDFFEGQNCNGFRYSAEDRADSNLHDNGDDNDRIRSINCRLHN